MQRDGWIVWGEPGCRLGSFTANPTVDFPVQLIISPLQTGSSSVSSLTRFDSQSLQQHKTAAFPSLCPSHLTHYYMPDTICQAQMLLAAADTALSVGIVPGSFDLHFASDIADDVHNAICHLPLVDTTAQCIQQTTL